MRGAPLHHRVRRAAAPRLGALAALGTTASVSAWAALVLAPGPAVGAAPPAPSDAAALYHAAIATTRGWSVHYASQAKVSKAATLVETGDAGPASGTQQVELSQGSAADHASIIVIGGITYLKGDAAALRDLAGLSPGQATAAAGQWVDFATNNAALSSVSDGVRSTDVANELALTGPYARGRDRTLNGQRVDSVEGTQTLRGRHAHVVLYVRADGSHVPVEEDSVSSAGKPNGTLQVVYSKWGEIVRPLAPQATASIGPVSST
jgi:hypothetical protein